VYTGLEIRTFIAMCILSLTGAESNGTLILPSPLFASGAFGMSKKPIQTLEEFGKGKTPALRKAIKPPIKGGIPQIAFNPGDSLQKA
jgi:hypothetical protein